MDLSNTELVVLSACETGLGDIDGSEGVFGLQRAFKMAGAKYVLMSLWNVKDQKTYEFMTMFYELWQGGKSIPEAYQETQSKMRTKYALPFAPRNWAGFVLLH
jgi:CHAT domain-containing protein